MDTRTEIPRVLIVCEGSKTEPNYFRSFRIANPVRDLDIRGEGMNTLSLVEQTEQIVNEDGPFDSVWCVFDRDSFPSANFDNAIAKAQSKHFEVAYSNEAFELWYLLHFDLLESGVDRAQYREMLTKRYGSRYEKNDREFVQWLRENGNVDQAITNAAELLRRCDPSSPKHLHCPSTTVHLLVEHLRSAAESARR